MEVIIVYMIGLISLITAISSIIIIIGHNEPIKIKKDYSKMKNIKIKVNTDEPTGCCYDAEWLEGVFEVKEGYIANRWYFIRGTRSLHHSWVMKSDCTVIPPKRIIGGELL